VHELLGKCDMPRLADSSDYPLTLRQTDQARSDFAAIESDLHFVMNTLTDRGLMALAGLWENWRSPSGEWVRSFAIVTTTPNELCAELHNRMPVVLSPDVWSEWLGEEPADPACLKALFAPYPAEKMACWPVSTRVGNVKNNDASLIEPAAGPRATHPGLAPPDAAQLADAVHGAEGAADGGAGADRGAAGEGAARGVSGSAPIKWTL
jgi:hypothetical protein